MANKFSITVTSEQMDRVFERLSQSIRELNSWEMEIRSRSVSLPGESVDDYWERVCGPCEPNRIDQITGYCGNNFPMSQSLVEQCRRDFENAMCEEQSIPVELPGYLIELPVKEEVLT